MAIAPLLLASSLLLAAGPPAEDAPLVLENARVRLEFDTRSGAWTGLVDRHDGSQLVARGGSAPLIPPRRRVLDEGRLRDVAGRVDLAGDWLYTPKPPAPGVEAEFRAGRFESVPWEATPVPSRRGVGDDRLKDRTGDFWYRRAFAMPAGGVRADREMALLIGAVDDFDVAYLNGTPIGRTGQDTPHFWESPRLYRVPAGLLKADGPNVLLLKVTNGSGEGGIAGPVLLGPAESLAGAVHDGDGSQVVRAERRREAAAEMLALTATSEGLEYRAEWALVDEAARFRRRLTVTNRSGQDQTLRTGIYDTPPLALGADLSVIFPGSLPVGDLPASRIDPGDSVRPRSEEPLVVLWDGASGRGLGSWFVEEDEFSPVSVSHAGGGLVLRHAQQVIVRLAPGDAVTLGDQSFWLSRGTRTAALAGVQEIYREIGLRAPGHAPPGLRSMVLYCGHPGGPPELNYRTYGGFRAIEAYLPTLESLGVDLLWFLPIWEHGDGVRWNLYSPFDHFRVSPLYGTEDELRRLAGAASKRGMRLMFDLVPHGPPDTTELAREHPEFVALTPEGKPAYAWEQLAFDNAHPGWQDYFRRVAEHDARDFGAIGARVDCAAGGPLNWNPAATNRPSRSSLAAGLGMTRAIREGFLRGRDEVVILPEEYTGANIYYRVADLTYDAQLYFAMADLLDRGASPGEWARTFQRFLHDQQQTLPPGALKMRWISNHDTVSWTFQKKRPLDAYGAGRMRALLALCALVEGVPMLYQGDEDPAVYGGRGPSSVDFLRRLYAVRKSRPELRDGRADYESVRATGGVFACTRSAGDRTALVLISFAPEAVETRVTAAGAPWPAGPWRDVMNDEEIGGDRVQMAPHQVRVLVPAAR